MKNTGKIFWGIILIIVGVIVALNVLEITDIDIFFDGWWTLFLIIPGLIGIFRSGDRLGSLFLLIFGAALLLAAQNIIEYDMIWKMLLPIALVFIGLKMIFGNIFMTPMVRLLGATPTCEQYSIDYATYVLFAAPFIAGNFVLNQSLRSEGSATL